MSHLVKMLTITALAVCVLLSMSAFAQSTPDSSLMPKVATPEAPSPSGSNWMSHRFELSIQGGGALGGNLGNPDHGSCKEGVPNGCEVTQSLNHDISGGGIYPSQLSGIRMFQRFGGVKPGSGAFIGLRLGWNFNPKWQLEFTWNHSRSDVAFDNQRLLDQNMAIFVAGGTGNNLPRTATFIGNANGKPRGDQNMWLVNLNRNFNVGNRLVPYIGAGVGAVSWYGGPRVAIDAFTANDTPFEEAIFTKNAGSATGFAFDVQAGAKYYVTSHFGLRGDFTNVFSYPQLDNRFSAIDASGHNGVAGALQPLTGQTGQSGRFSQSLFSGGVFWNFGGELASTGGAGHSGDRESLNDRFEISWNFGATRGSSFSGGDTTCAETVALSCDLSQDFSRFGIGVYNTKLAQAAPAFLTNGGIEPGSGWSTSGQIGFNLTPEWQLEFQYIHSGTGTHYTNEDQRDMVVSRWFADERCCSNTTPESDKLFMYAGGFDGTARGNQNTYLFNVNRSFNTKSRLVPYIGAGLGWENWFGNPRTYIIATASDGAGGLHRMDIDKRSSSESGFAFDFGAGFKYYVARHWGFRTDVKDVVSFPGDFKQTFNTIDVDGFLGTPGAVVAPSGVVKQNTGSFNQIHASGGVFLTF
ncbi:MAG: outer membrane beta-barrel protein [Terriglobales bacterium]|jgi:outer membrane protein W